MNDASRAQTPDLAACEREPIHIPGSIQPHGLLVRLQEPDLRIVQISENVSTIADLLPERLLDQPLDRLVDAAAAHAVRERARSGGLDGAPQYVQTVVLHNGRAFDALAHRYDDALILELEPADAGSVSFAGLYPIVRASIDRLGRANNLELLLDEAAHEARRILGFDRVLIYRFDRDWSGRVVAESRNDALPSYLDLRFPASDIPRQARKLYHVSRLRLIADVDYRPARLVPETGPGSAEPVDLSFAALRSVSPVHLEYMRNMGVGASMSISLIVKGALWGLISCHHAGPKNVPFALRAGCDHLGQVLSLQIESRLDAAEADHRLELRGQLVRLLAAMAQSDDFVTGMQRNQHGVLAFADAHGAAVVFQDQCTLFGHTPSPHQVTALAAWLDVSHSPEVFHTDCLSDVYPAALSIKAVASGVLAVSISKLHRSYVMWFRPEVVRTVKWGGDPRRPLHSEGDSERLHPRKSFDQWKETVQRRSIPWRDSQIDAAAEFRTAIVGIVLRKAEELAQLAGELRVANKELEAFSYSVSHDLRAPLRHIVGYADLLGEFEGRQLTERGRRFLTNITESARYAGTLVDNLLAFSQMGRAAMRPSTVDLNQLMPELVRSATQEYRAEMDRRSVEWQVGTLPIVQADVSFLRLALGNLLSNALKYTRGRSPARIEVGAYEQDDEHVLYVRDNGVGFDMKYVNKLFGVFQRLHRMEDFEGTGIGLANVRRIVTRHGGRTWAEGELDRGATFFVSLPKGAQGA